MTIGVRRALKHNGHAPSFAFSLEPHVYGGTDLTLVLLSDNVQKDLQTSIDYVKTTGWLETPQRHEDVDCFLRKKDGAKLCMGGSTWDTSRRQSWGRNSEESDIDSSGKLGK